MSDFPNKRDCEHGSKRGSCELCDCYEEIKEQQTEIEQLKQDFGLSQLSHKQKVDQLLSCEKALDERDEQIEQLKRDLSVFKLIFKNKPATQDYIAKIKLKQRAKGIEDAAREINDIYVKEQNLGNLGKNQFYWWSLILGHMTDKKKQLRKQAEGL